MEDQGCVMRIGRPMHYPLSLREFSQTQLIDIAAIRESYAIRKG